MRRGPLAGWAERGLARACCLQDYPLPANLNLSCGAGRSSSSRWALGSGFAGASGGVAHRLELVLEVLHDPLGVGDQLGVGGYAQHDAARVAEDADPEAEVPGLRDPEHHLVDPAAGQVQRLTRTRDVCEHRGRLAAEE